MGRKWPPIVVTLRDDDIAGIPVLPVMAPLQTRDLCGGMIAGCRAERGGGLQIVHGGAAHLLGVGLIVVGEADHSGIVFSARHDRQLNITQFGSESGVPHVLVLL